MKTEAFTCPRCQSVLGHSRGDRLQIGDHFVFHRVKIKCGACGHETRWKPVYETRESVDRRDSPK